MKKLYPLVKYSKQVLILFLLIFGIGFQNISAQNQLERVSIAERSDGRGFVIRFHLTEMVDSFNVAQPDLDHIQIRLYSDDLNVENVDLPANNQAIQDLQLVSLDDGIGVEIKVRNSNYFDAGAYPDQNMRDLLLSLEYTNETTLVENVNSSEYLFETPTEDTPSDLKPEVAEPQRNSPHQEDEISTSLADQKESTRRAGLKQRISPRDPFDLYLRFIPEVHSTKTQSSVNLRPGFEDFGTMAEILLAAHPWMNHPVFKEPSLNLGLDGLAIYTPYVFVSHNDEIPWGKNDGALWQGVGLNYQFSTGLRYKKGPITVAFRPEFTYSENKEYFRSNIPEHEGLHDLAMRLAYIDVPMRFWYDPFSEFNLGDSFIQFDYSGFAAGISNENLWTGPAVENPLIFSNNAPGFLHGFVGTAEPFDTGYGTIEGKWLWGGLQESEYFDRDSTNNLRYITALTLNYSPSFVPGLNVGINRAAYSYFGDDGLGFSDIFMALHRPPSKYDVEDKGSVKDPYFIMTSFFASFDIPKQGFEVYFEFGRNDFRRPLRDFLGQPDLNTGYVLGFMKRFNLTPRKRILFNMELTNLENSTVSQQFRDFNIWHTNEVIQQGFTHQGQVLGAGIGPGSSIQKFKLSYYDTWGMVGASLARVAHNIDRHFKYKDFFLSKDYVGFEGALLTSRHEIEIRKQLTALIFLPLNFEIQVDYSIGKIENRYNVAYYDLTNRNVAFTLRYNLPGFLR